MATIKTDIVYWLEKIANALTTPEPVFPISYEVNDITSIDGDVLDALKCGDQVIKKSITTYPPESAGHVQHHTYTVSYKGEGVGEGLCLTYTDASVIETVSYDHTSDGWAYNSTDKWENPDA